MFRKFAPRLANLSLRVLAMASRLLLIVALARLLTPAEVGTYGLFAATIAFGMLVIGGDFHTHSVRDLLSSSPQRHSFILQHHMAAALLLYALLLPLTALVFVFDLLPGRLAGYFFALLIVEHLAQEIDRVLNALHRQLVASSVLFLRLGLWAWIVVPLMWSDDDLRRLETVLVAWVSGGTLSLLLGGAVIWHNTRPWRRWPLDMSWIRRGLAVGLTFLVATLSARALLTVDRYIVEHFSSTEFLGAYVVYSSMAMAIMSVLDPAVFSFLYPRLVSAYRTNDMAKYTSTMREMAFSAAGVSALVTIAGAIVAPYVFAWTGKPVYSEHADIFRLLLLAAFIYAMNWVPHYGLYARGADRIILTAHLVSLPVFALTAIPLGSLFPQAAAPLGLIAAFTWLTAFKAWHYWRLRKAQAGALTAATGAGAHASS